MRRFAGGLLTVMLIVSMTGCTKGDKVKKTTLYVEDNGRVTEAIAETLDKDYYDSGELKNWIADEVKEYNRQAGDAVEVKKCEVEGKTARVTIEYDSMKDYAEFNNVKAFCGTIAEAEKAGYEFKGDFKSANDKPAITYTELEGSKSYSVVIVEESQKVVLDEDVLYASSNVKVKGKTAAVETGVKELAYIIYKS